MQGTSHVSSRPSSRGSARGSSRTASRATGKTRRQNPISRIVNAWFDRLLGVVNDGGFANQHEEYAAGRTTRDFICNTLGISAFGIVFPLLTIIATQLTSIEEAGMFSLAFVMGLMLMYVANYGVRAYQVSDLEEEHSFTDYQIARVITCVLMLIIGHVYCHLRGYDDTMRLICTGVFFYKMVDGLADVYEGRLQQVDKLYLAGISQALRSVAVLATFAVTLLITRSLGVASIAMAVAAGASFLALTFPLALLETPRSRKWSLASVGRLLKQCFPLFVALFMYNLIDNMPKFVMEGVLSYDSQLYFNALYFPAHAILLIAGAVYKPLLRRMAAVWSEPAKRLRFDLIIVAVTGTIVVLTAIMLLIMATFGLNLLGFLYGIDFEDYRGLCYIMLVAGGVTACIDFVYQTIAVLRRQLAVVKLYFITFAFSLFVPVLLINFTGLPGAIIGYLIVMSILFVLLIWEYLRIRMAFHREQRAAVAAAKAEAEAAGSDKRLRPSEARALRKRQEAHRRGERPSRNEREE